MDRILQMGDLANLNRVVEAEKLMLQLPQIELNHFDHFSKDVYARELHIPKGVMLTGKIHKQQNLNILAKGRIKVLVGDEVKEVAAPFVVVSPPGTKRIALALEDCVWITVHGTDEKDVDKIEHQFIAQDEKEYLEFIVQDQLALPGI